MKLLLIIASIIALAVAGPANRDFVEPAPIEPVPVESGGISIGPAIIEGPLSPVSIGPAIVDNLPISSNTPLVQIILNINPAAPVAPVPEPEPAPGPSPVPAPAPAPIPADPVQVVDAAPVEIGIPELPTPEFIPEPVQIGTPQLPIIPGAVLPDQLN